MGEQPQRAYRAPAEGLAKATEATLRRRARRIAERGPGEDRTFDRLPAMAELHRMVGQAYGAQLRRMMQVIDEYVSQIAAMRSGPHLITPTDLAHIREIISDFHLAFAAGVIHPEAIAPKVLQGLVDKGILPQDLAFTYQPVTPRDLPPSRLSMVDTSFDYGRALIPLHEPRRPHLRAVSLEAFSAVPMTPLSTEESAARDWARHNAAMHITGLGDKFTADLSGRVLDADREQRRKYEELIRRRVSTAIAKRETWRSIATEIGEETEDWSRGLRRIAATESHTAMQNGVAEGLKTRTGKAAEEVWVAKQPAPDACVDCVRLHLTGGKGSSPRIFKLSDLEDNGTNVGKKRAGWKAAVGATHPWCGCDLIHVPEGWEFDEDGNLVPQSLKRSEWLDHDLRKAFDMTYGDAVPDEGIAVRVGDPQVRQAVDAVIAVTPPEVFNKKVGVTLITTDIPRVQNPLDDHDFAYWTANEIRLMNDLPAWKIERVLPHEIGHSLNVYLMNKLGGVKPVRAWHDDLWKISKDEGWVSDYAKKLPIENAAEVSMLYLYNRKRLMLDYPRQFAFVHKHYRPIFAKRAS